MAVICNTFTTWVTQEVLEPVEKFVKKSKNACKKAKWWNPLKWICWLVWFVVAVTVWIVKEILVPLNQFICRVVWSILWITIAPFIAAWDAAAGTSLFGKLKKWMYWSNPKIEYSDKQGPDAKGEFEYQFICKCSEKRKTSVTVKAYNDEQAAKKAKKECDKACGKI